MKTASTLVLLLFTASLAGAVFADNLGVLFTTPEQRAALDAGHNEDPGNISAAAPELVRTRPATITLNGTLVSSVGNREVWLNGEPSLKGNRRSAANIRILGRNRVRLQTGSASASHVLKPGQVVDLGSGRIDEAYSHRLQAEPQ